MHIARLTLQAVINREVSVHSTYIQQINSEIIKLHRHTVRYAAEIIDVCIQMFIFILYSHHNYDPKNTNSFMQESIESKRIRQLDYCIIIRAHALIIQNKKRVSLVFPN